MTPSAKEATKEEKQVKEAKVLMSYVTTAEEKDTLPGTAHNRTTPMYQPGQTDHLHRMEDGMPREDRTITARAKAKVRTMVGTPGREAVHTA